MLSLSSRSPLPLDAGERPMILGSKRTDHGLVNSDTPVTENWKHLYRVAKTQAPCPAIGSHNLEWRESDPLFIREKADQRLAGCRQDQTQQATFFA